MENPDVNMNHNNFATTSHCLGCGRCFCSTAKLQAIDGSAICMNCKPGYEQKLRNNNNLPSQHNMYPR